MPARLMKKAQLPKPSDIQRTAVLKTAVHWLEQYSDTTNDPPSNGFFFFRFARRVNFKIVC
jgi:hypothetical protein